MVVGLSVSPVLGRQKQEDYHKFEVHLAYAVRSRPARTVSNKNQNRNKARRKRSRDWLVAAGRRLSTHAYVGSPFERCFLLCGKRDRRSTDLIPPSV